LQADSLLADLEMLRSLCIAKTRYRVQNGALVVTNLGYAKPSYGECKIEKKKKNYLVINSE
jgi:hypothetical protein